MDTSPPTPSKKRRISAPSHHAKPKKRIIGADSLYLALPDAPAGMSPIAAAEWRRVGPRLIALGLLDLDLGTLGSMCDTVSDLADIRAAWKREGSPTVIARPAGMRIHPAVAAMRSLRSDLLRYQHALGMTLSARKILAIELGAAPIEAETQPQGSGAVGHEADIAARFFN